MYTLMHYMRTAASKTIIANITLEMSIVSLCKVVITNITFQRLLSNVMLLMPFKMTFPHEIFTATVIFVTLIFQRANGVC
jgi:hypothetical protein